MSCLKCIFRRFCLKYTIALFILILLIYPLVLHISTISLPFSFFFFNNPRQRKSTQKVEPQCISLGQIDKKSPITVQQFQCLAKYNLSYLLQHYHQFTRNHQPTEYRTLLPIHANGLLKEEIDYHDFLSIDNVNIKHFTSFLNHGDKHEFNQSPYLIKSLNGLTILPSNQKSNFTIIYSIGLSNPNSFLLRQISALYHPEAAFILILDNKGNRTSLYNLLETEKSNPKFENVYIVDSPRFQVKWGQITQAFLQFVGGLAALKFFPDSLYVSFHSQADYPIVPNDVIIHYLQKHYPDNYVETEANPGFKVRRYHDFFLFDHPQEREIVSMVRYLFPTKVIPKAKWNNGRNWFTMTIKDFRKMIDVTFQRFDLIDTIEYSLCADEVIFATLVFEAGINITQNTLRYIDWRLHIASPLTFTENHFQDIVDHIKRCNFWARKFNNEKSLKVLDMLDDYINKMKVEEYGKHVYVIQSVYVKEQNQSNLEKQHQIFDDENTQNENEEIDQNIYQHQIHNENQIDVNNQLQIENNQSINENHEQITNQENTSSKTNLSDSLLSLAFLATAAAALEGIDLPPELIVSVLDCLPDQRALAAYIALTQRDETVDLILNRIMNIQPSPLLLKILLSAMKFENRHPLLADVVKEFFIYLFLFRDFNKL